MRAAYDCGVFVVDTSSIENLRHVLKYRTSGLKVVEIGFTRIEVLDGGSV